MKIVLLCTLLFVAVLSSEVKIRFETTVGNVTVHAQRQWAPLGFDRFMELVKEKYFDDAGFFRVVPGFVVQFGISGNTTQSAKWRNRSIQDDKVIKSNVRGWISYAATSAPNSRTTQLFINYGNNARLDAMRFAPFAYINEEDMKIIDKINSEYGQRPSQDQIYSRGNEYLKKDFPRMSFLKKAYVMN